VWLSNLFYSKVDVLTLQGDLREIVFKDSFQVTMAIKSNEINS
jgi:hypothetical protein